MKILLIFTHSGAGLFYPCRSQWELRDVLVGDIPVCSASDRNNGHSAPILSLQVGWRVLSSLPCCSVCWWGFIRLLGVTGWEDLITGAVPKFPIPGLLTLPEFHETGCSSKIKCSSPCASCHPGVLTNPSLLPHPWVVQDSPVALRRMLGALAGRLCLWNRIAFGG